MNDRSSQKSPNSVKSIKQLFINLLKKKLTHDDYDEMSQGLLNFVHKMRKREQVDIKQAHNLTLLLIDVDQYKDNFEVLLLEETEIFYSDLAQQKLDLYVSLRLW